MPGGLSQRASGASKGRSAALAGVPEQETSVPIVWSWRVALRAGPSRGWSAAHWSPGHWTMGVELVTRDIPGERGQLEAGRDRVHRVAGLQPRARSGGSLCPCHPGCPLGQALGWLPFPCDRLGARHLEAASLLLGSCQEEAERQQP